MPCVYDREVSQESGNKRRKTTVMARRQWEEEEGDTHDQSHDDVPEQPREAAEMEAPIQTSNREELMECIKSGRNTIWVPSPTLERLTAEHSGVNPDSAHLGSAQTQELQSRHIDTPPTLSHSITIPPLAILDPIERPRSALHTGDFRQSSVTVSTPQRLRRFRDQDGNSFPNDYSTSPPPWSQYTPIPSLGRYHTDPKALASSTADGARRSRAPSLGSSLSSSFVMRVPTSPLVNATSHTTQDPDLSSLSTSTDKANRRRTLPPESFRSLQTTPAEHHAPNFSRPFIQPHVYRENLPPSRGHQPRRSLTSFTYQPASNNQVPSFLRSRRPSTSSEASPRASMVGSFEESILRGRMSTAPSKPINFIAQIGVLGKGNCKPSLRCPAHAIVPFPAVFYSYPSIPSSRSAIDENPSPYVGSIDLEHNLTPVETAKQRKQKALDSRDPEELMADITAPENTAIGRAIARDAKARRKEATALKAPPGGCYRIPQEGQLQVIIKNPNKTAVKLYLVPYDLTGMEPGTKTFVRQRSYSAGPLLDNPITGDSQNQRKFDALQDKHILRYLIHLKICCLSKDRFYLYDNVRVVFANRVPDGKEKLRNETQLPYPKYSPYKPGKERSRSNSEILNNRTNHRQGLKRGTPDSPQDVFDEVESLSLFISDEDRSKMPASAIPFYPAHRPKAPFARSEPSQVTRQDFDTPPVPQVPFQFRDLPTSLNSERAVSPTPGFTQPSTSTRASPVPWGSLRDGSSQRSFSPVPPESGDGLLSRKLRDFNGHMAEHTAKHG
jgi:Domain of unknown function (DUF4210)/Chromosome segregation during meiosis